MVDPKNESSVKRGTPCPKCGNRIGVYTSKRVSNGTMMQRYTCCKSCRDGASYGKEVVPISQCPTRLLNNQRLNISRP